MKFTNLALVSVLAMGLSACAGFTSPPPQSVPTEVVTSTTNDTSVLEVQTLPGVAIRTAPTTDADGNPIDPALGPVTLPNPYLANPRSVSGGVQKMFDKALELHRDKNWSEAELAWQELALTAPKLSGPVLNLGIVYEATGKPELAESSYRKAIEVNNLNVNAYNHLAILKRKQGDFTGAEKLYGQALQVWPDHPASHRNVAILYDLYMGKLEQALAHYERYRDLTPEPEAALKGWIRDLQRRLDIKT